MSFKKIGISVLIMIIIYVLVQYPIWGRLDYPSYGFGVFTICVHEIVCEVVDEYNKKKGNKK